MKSEQLKFVVKAVYSQMKSIILIFVLVIETIYVLSIIAFVFFQERYSSLSNPANEMVNCGNLAACFFSNVHYGMKEKGKTTNLKT